jgi:hypothetical protein
MRFFLLSANETRSIGSLRTIAASLHSTFHSTPKSTNLPLPDTISYNIGIRQNITDKASVIDKKTLTITTHEDLSKADRAYWRSRTPQERLDEVERLRLEAGKFLYEYPTRLRRVLEVTRDTSS